MDYTALTEVTDDDARRLGRYILNLSAIAAALGHVSPIGTVRDYIAADSARLDPMYWVALDIFRGAGHGSSDDVIDARERLRTFIDSTGYLDLVAAAAVR